AGAPAMVLVGDCIPGGVAPKAGDGAPAGVAPNEGDGAPGGVAPPSGTPVAVPPGSGVPTGVAPCGVLPAAVVPGPLMLAGGVPEDSVARPSPSAVSVFVLICPVASIARERCSWRSASTVCSVSCPVAGPGLKPRAASWTWTSRTVSEGTSLL